ncbi:hypothetical protein DFH08DRAFT_819733 [Mycena albidolilacea]|uniref:Uncharacterized protein n=1 Tax=Mycena albidolilacea TaxID=1033008 RepID=A0AAD6ZEV7_9AGAR|nr:hypothetical protein DFH08DRAFT_819733 [Mycena albidolilacea]
MPSSIPSSKPRNYLIMFQAEALRVLTDMARFHWSGALLGPIKPASICDNDKRSPDKISTDKISIASFQSQSICLPPPTNDVEMTRSVTSDASLPIASTGKHLHLEESRKKTRERMARVRAALTEEQRERHREAQQRYRERYRERIAHRARRATVQKNAEAGRTTKPRPKARHYWSDLDLVSSDEEEDDEW